MHERNKINFKLENIQTKNREKHLLNLYNFLRRKLPEITLFSVVIL